MNLPRLLRTVSYLRPVQITNRVTRRVPVRRRALFWQLRRQSAPFVRFAEYYPTPLTAASRLRDYTFHYHHWVDAEAALNWIESNPRGLRPAWEPYPLSRRIVNWVKHIECPSDRILTSLAQQADYLSHTVEHHLLGNHLFVNAKALVFAGIYLSVDRWLRQGLEILGHEVPEQILRDGGHFELSPMYHSLILEDLLDLVNLGRAYPGLLPDFSEPAARMLCWAKHMSHPDGDIAFFNDTAFGVAAPAGELCAYATRLGIKPATQPLSDSGYIRLENDNTLVLFDAAPVGSTYQPGHAHADTLSFELSHRGRRIAVNSGTSTYEKSAERQRQRGTAAHNTVRIDGRDSSEVWGAFRVGARARVVAVSTDHCTWAEASHDGYRPIIHRRRLELFSKRLAITDWIEGIGDHSLEIYFHMVPGIDARLVSLDPALIRSVHGTTFHPHFDLSIPNQTVFGRWSGKLPVRLTSVISLPD